MHSIPPLRHIPQHRFAIVLGSGGVRSIAALGMVEVLAREGLQPDLVTMDLVMPYRNGIDATREILRGDNKALVVMCSALGQETMVMEAIEAGASDFIVKPFKSEDVLSVVKKVLGDA